MKKHWHWLVAVIVLMLAAAVIRGVPAYHLPFWFDEADTWRASIVDADYQPMSYVKFLTWSHHFEHAPIGYLLPRVAADIFGSDSPFVMRLPALIAGVLCVPAAFVLGWVVHRRLTGLLAAAMVAFDPNMVDQSIQCRMYTIWMLLTLIALTWAIVMLRNPKRSWWHWGGLGVTLGLMLSTTPLAVMPWIGIAAGVVLLLGAGRVMKQKHPAEVRVVVGFTVAYLLACAIACVGVYRVVDRLITGGEGGDGRDLGIAFIVKEVVVAASDLIGLTHAGLLIYVAAAVGLLLYARTCKTSVAVLVALTGVTVVLLLPFRKQHHFMDARYVSMLQPALWIGLALLPAAFKQVPLKGVAIALVVAYTGVQAWQSTHLQQWQSQPDRYLFTSEIIRVDDRMASGDAFWVDPPASDILSRYYGLEPDPALKLGLEANYKLSPDAHVPDTFDAPKVWLVVGLINYDGRFPDITRLIHAIAAHYNLAVNESVLKTQLRTQRVLTIEFSRESAKLRVVGLPDDLREPVSMTLALPVAERAEIAKAIPIQP
jgi:4-amino-4-deoxy-L-arabinose transferase-like glycosyltransferase